MKTDERSRVSRGRSRLRARADELLRPSAEDSGIVSDAPEIPIREVLRRFWPDARPYRRWIPLGLLLIALGAAIETAEIWIFQYVVDEVLVPGNLEPLIYLGIGYAGLVLVNGLISFGDDYLATWLAEHFLLAMRSRLFGHLQRLSLDVLDRRRLGDVLARLTDDIEAIESFVVTGVSDALAATLQIIFFTAALILLQWDLALISLAVAPLFFVAARRFSGLIKHAAREDRRHTGSLSSIAEESLGNLALIQASNREDDERERFVRENRGIVEAELAASRIEGLFSPLVNLIQLAGVMAVLVVGTMAVADGRLTLGGLLVFVAFLTQLYGPIQELGSLSNTIFQALAGAERVIELLDEHPAIVEAPRARSARSLHGRARGAVELHSVDFTYPGAEARALEDVSLSAAPGETIALVGPSGAGKSTLAKLLLRFYDPDAGTVCLDGHDLCELELRSVRSNVALLLQETLVLHRSVRDNIALARPGADDASIRAAARAAGAHEFISALPNGYDSDVGERGRRLSGGQRQRIAIARAFLTDAPVLVLDEPATGLDSRSTADLTGLLENLMRERTTIVVSHDLLTTRSADLIIVLDRGRIVERGRHEDLIAANGLYCRLWELRQIGHSHEGAHPFQA